MDYAHIVRRDRINHMVVTTARRVHTDGTKHTVCAKLVDQTFQPRPDDVPTCPRCVRFMVAFMDFLEQPEMFTAHARTQPPTYSKGYPQ